MEAIINKEQIDKVAEAIKNLPEQTTGCNWYSFEKNGQIIVDTETYPSLYYPQIVNFFFFVVSHDYGFWYGDDKGYLGPLYGTIEGKKAKGSDLLWKMATRALLQDETRFEPRRLADISPEELSREIFFDDNGPVIWPDFETRFRNTRAYGRWFQENNAYPLNILNKANHARKPLNCFLHQLRSIPGYNQDPLEKKNLLLAMMLFNRPEQFLKVTDPENWKPLVDYHVMRLALRLGIVELDNEEQEINRQRLWTSARSERIIREASYEAAKRIIRIAGRPMPFVDDKLWHARRYCPEMTEPECSKCVFDDVCKKRVELFQPIFRTTAY